MNEFPPTGSVRDKRRNHNTAAGTSKDAVAFWINQRGGDCNNPRISAPGMATTSWQSHSGFMTARIPSSFVTKDKKRSLHVLAIFLSIHPFHFSNYSQKTHLKAHFSVRILNPKNFNVRHSRCFRCATQPNQEAGIWVHKMLSFLVSSQTARPFGFFPVGLHGVTDESRVLTAFFETCLQMRHTMWHPRFPSFCIKISLHFLH